MENKINIAELLKDCPEGMELDCTIYEDVVFHDIVDRYYPIRVRRKQGGLINLNAYGCINDKIESKCIIFPKGKTTWEGFHRPFKDGDILVYTNSHTTTVFIHRNKDNEPEHTTSFYVGYTTGVCHHNFHIYNKSTLIALNGDCDVRLATEEEKTKLFQAIKDNGYKWNDKTKTLEKLVEPKFHKGDWIVFNGLTLYVKEVVKDFYRTISKGDGIANSYDWGIDNAARLWTIQDAKDSDVLCTYECSEPKIVFILKGTPKKHYALSYHCYYNIMYPHFASDSEKGCLAPNDEDVKPATKEQRDTLFAKMKETGYKWNTGTKTLEKLIEPKFKVGDKIKTKVGTSTIETKSEKLTIIEIKSDRYIVEEVSGDFSVLPFVAQDYWELVSNKFDISTLKSFESRVLVRNADGDLWKPAIYGFPHSKGCYVVGGVYWRQCIPYEANKEILGTTNDCDGFYKTWTES